MKTTEKRTLSAAQRRISPCQGENAAVAAAQRGSLVLFLLLLLLLLSMTELIPSSYAQYNPIPNFTGTLAGQQFRNALNAKLGGSDTISPQIVHINFFQLPATVVNGQEFYVNDAAPGTPCVGGGSGAIAIGQNGVWSCGPIPGGTVTPTSVACSHLTTLVGAGTFNAGATNNAGSFLTPNSTTDVDNCTITFSIPSPQARSCKYSAKTNDASATMIPAGTGSTTTTATVAFASSGGTVTGLDRVTIGYVCF
jgi:hypothetical protein